MGYYDREYPDLFNDSRLRCLESKITDDKELFAFESKIILARRAYTVLQNELNSAEAIILEALEARRLYEQFQCTEPSLLSYEQVRATITGQLPLSVRSRDLTPTKRRNRFSRPVEAKQTKPRLSQHIPSPKTQSPIMKELLDYDKELDFKIKSRSKSVTSYAKNSDCYEVYLKSILLKVTKVTKEGDRVVTRKRTASDYSFVNKNQYDQGLALLRKKISDNEEILLEAQKPKEIKGQEEVKKSKKRNRKNNKKYMEKKRLRQERRFKEFILKKELLEDKALLDLVTDQGLLK